MKFVAERSKLAEEIVIKSGTAGAKQATRRAVEIRDRLNGEGTCFDEICDEPIERCQVDHIHEYREGGLTIQLNGRCACGFHNRSRNKRKPDAD